jgi:hypothetical protein
MGETSDEIINNAQHIVPDLAKSLPGQSERITRVVENLQEKKPEIAKGLLTASVICK